MDPLHSLFINMQVRIGDTRVVGMPMIRNNLFALCIQKRIAILLGFGFVLTSLLGIWKRSEYLRNRNFVVCIVAADEGHVGLIINFVEFFGLLESR